MTDSSFSFHFVWRISFPRQQLVDPLSDTCVSKSLEIQEFSLSIRIRIIIIWEKNTFYANFRMITPQIHLVDLPKEQSLFGIQGCK